MSVLSNSKESMNNKNKCYFKNDALVVWLSVIHLSDTVAILQCRYVNRKRKAS